MFEPCTDNLQAQYGLILSVQGKLPSLGVISKSARDSMPATISKSRRYGLAEKAVTYKSPVYGTVGEIAVTCKSLDLPINATLHFWCE